MNDVEGNILILTKELCKQVPLHVEKWRDVLPSLINKVKGVANMAEQLRAVSEVNIEYMPQFQEVQESLRYNILTCIEEDFVFVKDSLDKISRFNSQFRDKLEKLEHSSLQLDWEEGKSMLIQGTPLIPPLGQLLQYSLDFYIFFNLSYKNMWSCTKTMAFMDEENMKNWENSFIIDLDSNESINRLVAITQYVDNDVLT